MAMAPDDIVEHYRQRRSQMQGMSSARGVQGVAPQAFARSEDEPEMTRSGAPLTLTPRDFNRPTNDHEALARTQTSARRPLKSSHTMHPQVFGQVPTGAPTYTGAPAATRSLANSTQQQQMQIAPPPYSQTLQHSHSHSQPHSSHPPAAHSQSQQQQQHQLQQQPPSHSRQSPVDDYRMAEPSGPPSYGQGYRGSRRRTEPQSMGQRMKPQPPVSNINALRWKMRP